MGIDVTLHINKLENGIRTLRRHLSSSSSSPPLLRKNSALHRTTPPETLSRQQSGNLPVVMVSQRSVLVWRSDL